MEQGWVKLYRKIEHNDFLWYDNNAFLVFTRLMLLVNKDDGSYRTGQRALADKFNMPYGTLYKVLQRLQRENLILIENKEKYSKIWIVNWTAYQSNREIDKILEHNALQVRKQPGKRVLQSKKALQEADGEAQGKQEGSTREDYNKNKELRIKNSSTNVEAAKPRSYGNKDVNDLFEYWQQTMGYPISSKVADNRKAAYNLSRNAKIGLETTKRAIVWVGIAHGDRYASKEVKASDFVELQTNFNKIYAWARGRALTTNNETARFA